jgi:hypothetical protein
VGVKVGLAESVRVAVKVRLAEGLGVGVKVGLAEGVRVATTVFVLDAVMSGVDETDGEAENAGLGLLVSVVLGDAVAV